MKVLLIRKKLNKGRTEVDQTESYCFQDATNYITVPYADLWMYFFYFGN